MENLSQQENSSQWKRDIDNLLNNFHSYAATSQYEKYFECFNSNGCFIGTDGTEHWTIEQFKVFCLPYFNRKSAWIYTPLTDKRSLFPFYQERNRNHDDNTQGNNLSDDIPTMVSFDELLLSQSLNCEVRGSGTIVWNSENNKWEILSYYLSFPIPDAVSNRVATLIHDHHTSIVKTTEQIDLKILEANADAAAAALLAELELESNSSKKSNKQQKKKNKKKR